MNALPLHLPTTPSPAPSMPTPGTPPRGAPEGGFAKCLDRAVEREPMKPPASPSDKLRREVEPTAGPDTVDADDAAAEARPAAGARRGPAARATKPAAPPPGAAATPAPLPSPANPVAAADTQDTAGLAAPTTGPSADDPVHPGALVPGWPPVPTVSAAPVSDGSVSPAVKASGAGDGGSAADVTFSAAPSSARAVTAEACSTGPAPPALGASEHAMPAPFALPPPPGGVASTPPPETPGVAQAHVAAPLDSPGFAPALATQVRWLVRDGLQHAQLSLNPAEMGPVTVQILLDGRDARIDFRADLAVTRQALEASLPVLAAALDDSGLRLSGGGVHDGQASPHGQPGWAGARAPVPGSGMDGRGGHAAASEAASSPARPRAPARGLVDLVA